MHCRSKRKREEGGRMRKPCLGGKGNYFVGVIGWEESVEWQ